MIHITSETKLHQKCNQQMALPIRPREKKGAWIGHPNQLLICNAYLVTNTKPTAKFIHPIHMKQVEVGSIWLWKSYKILKETRASPPTPLVQASTNVHNICKSLQDFS